MTDKERAVAIASFIEERAFGDPAIVETLIANLATLRAETWALAIEGAAGVCLSEQRAYSRPASSDQDAALDGVAINALSEAEQRIRALAPDPNLRVVNRADLRHATGECGCVFYDKLDGLTRRTLRMWPPEHSAAIERLK